MVTMTGIYQGQKRCQSTHGPSQNKIITDAPLDNNGKGEAFSPTDLVGAALGSCMLTVMGIYAEKNNIDLTGSTFEVVKKMKLAPRMIAELTIEVKMPKALGQEERATLEEIAHNCPVKKSLHPEVKIPLTFNYSL